MLKPRRLAFCTALGIAIAMLGCGKPSESGVADGQKLSPISFMIFGDPGELAAYKELVAAFEAKHGLKVKLIHLPSQSDYRKRLGVDFAAGTPADVVLINYRRFASLAEKGVIEPLGPYMERSSVIKEADFYPEAIKAFRWKDELMGIPQNLSSLVVYYNKKHFVEANLPFPKSDWTWREFADTADILSRDPKDPKSTDRHGLGTEVSLQRLAPFIWQNSATLVDDDVNPTKLTLDTPEALEAVQFFVNLLREHHAVPDRVEEKSEDSESRFINGRTSMFLNSRRGVPAYREITAFDWDVAPLPRWKERAGILHSDAYFMSKAAKNKDQVWKFIEFANSVEGQTITAKSGRTVPSLKAVAESKAFLDPDKKPANSKVFLDVIPDLHLVPISPVWVDIEELASDELERGFYGKDPVENVVEVLTERAAEYFKRRGTQK